MRRRIVSIIHNKKNDIESVINVYKKQQSSKLFSSALRHDLNKTAHHNVQRFKLQNVQNTRMPIYFFLRSAT